MQGNQIGAAFWYFDTAPLGLFSPHTGKPSLANTVSMAPECMYAYFFETLADCLVTMEPLTSSWSA
jgi:hypothetical protein